MRQLTSVSGVNSTMENGPRARAYGIRFTGRRKRPFVSRLFDVRPARKRGHGPVRGPVRACIVPGRRTNRFIPRIALKLSSFLLLHHKHRRPNGHRTESVRCPAFRIDENSTDTHTHTGDSSDCFEATRQVRSRP
jgi:hypothetical protein